MILLYYFPTFSFCQRTSSFSLQVDHLLDDKAVTSENDAFRVFLTRNFHNVSRRIIIFRSITSVNIHRKAKRLNFLKIPLVYGVGSPEKRFVKQPFLRKRNVAEWFFLSPSGFLDSICWHRIRSSRIYPALKSRSTDTNRATVETVVLLQPVPSRRTSRLVFVGS